MVSVLVRILMVIAEDLFRDEEFAEPYKLFTGKGHRVTVVSTSLKVATGELGMKVMPEATIDSVNPDDYDAISIAGGDGTPIYLWPNKALHRAAQRIYDRGGVVGAICFAPVVLARAGMMANRQCTVWVTPESVQEIVSAGGRLQKEHVVVDGRIVTADGPEAAIDYGRAVLGLIEKVK